MGCGTTIEAPEPRDLAQEVNDILEANTRYAPEQYDLESTYRPKYAELDRSIAWDNMFADDGILKMQLDSVDKIAENNRLANTASREADMADATNLGGDLLDLQKSLNPELYDQLTKIQEKANQDTGPSAAMNALRSSLGIPMQVSAQNMAAVQGRSGAATVSAGGDRPTVRGVPIEGPMPQVNVNAASQNKVGTPIVGRVDAPDQVTAGDAALVDGVEVDLATANAKQVGDVANRRSSPVLDAIQSQALGDLALGGSLDQRTKSDIGQSVLEQYNKMGRSMDNRAMTAIASELDKASNQRLNERFGRAMTAEGAIQDQQRTNVGIDQGNQAVQAGNAQLDLQAQLANQGNKLSVAGMDLQTQLANQDSRNRATDNALEADLSNARNKIAVGEMNQAGDIAGGQLALGASTVNQAADAQYRQGLQDLATMEERADAVDFSNMQQVLGNYLATQFDPTQGVLGRPSVNQTNFNAAKVNGNFNSDPSGSLNVFNNYASQLNGQNFSEANQNARQQASTNAGLLAGTIGAIGNVGGAFIGAGG